MEERSTWDVIRCSTTGIIGRHIFSCLAWTVDGCFRPETLIKAVRMSPTENNILRLIWCNCFNKQQQMTYKAAPFQYPLFNLVSSLLLKVAFMWLHDKSGWCSTFSQLSAQPGQFPALATEAGAQMWALANGEDRNIRQVQKQRWKPLLVGWTYTGFRWLHRHGIIYLKFYECNSISSEIKSKFLMTFQLSKSWIHYD